MELLIAGGIALIGYNLSSDAPPRRPERRPKRVPRLGPSNEYAEPGNTTLDATKRHVALAAARWEAARDPALTGIVSPQTKLTNAMLPFFRSARSQNTNDAVKQTLLEKFTGATSMDTSLTGTYRSKHEVEAMFSPSQNAAAVTSGGTSGNHAVERDLRRYEPGIMHNNVLPAEQIRVGRGVGVGPDVAAADGFHPMYRVPVKNVGEYKKNNLPGQVNHGAAAGGKNASEVPRAELSVNQATGALVYDLERRPLQPTMASVLAPSEIPLQHDGNRKLWLHTGDRFGNPGHAGHEARGTREARHDGRDDPDRNHSMPHINLDGTDAGVGGFTDYSYDRSRIDSQQREQLGGNGFVSGPKARTAPTRHILPPTMRDVTSASLTGPAAAASFGHSVHHLDEPRTTLRDTQGESSALFGTTAAVKGGMLDNVWRYKRLNRDGAKRALVEDHAPLPGRVNVTDSWEHASVSLRNDADQRAPALFAPTPLDKTYQTNVGKRTAPNNKLPSNNPRLQDLSVAAKQLQSNPYAKSLCTM